MSTVNSIKMKILFSFASFFDTREPICRYVFTRENGIRIILMRASAYIEFEEGCDIITKILGGGGWKM